MKYISFIALVISVGALAVTLTRVPILTEIIRPANNEPDEALQEELLMLRLRLAALEKKITSEKDSQSIPLPKLQEQVTELSSFQADLAEYALNIDPLGVIQVTEREIETAYDILMDESRSPAERAKQAALLKRYGQFDQAAVDSMKALFLTVEDPNQKAAALVALKGHITPTVRDGVLHAFTTDIGNGYKSGRLRYHGIEALEPLLPDPEVEAILRHLAQNDPEPKIAGRAAKAVGLPFSAKESRPLAVDVDSSDTFKEETDNDNG